MKFRPFASHSEVAVSGRNLPHWRQQGGCYFITFRLADSLPQTLLQEWRDEKEAWLEEHPQPRSDEEERHYEELFHQRRQEWLDAGYGACPLRDPGVRKLVDQSLLKFDGERYALDSYVVMPNHVHLIWQLFADSDLSRELKGLKGGSARQCNLALGRSGSFWMDESYDRLVRDSKELSALRDYIEKNPENARLGENEYSLYTPHALEI